MELERLAKEHKKFLETTNIVITRKPPLSHDTVFHIEVPPSSREEIRFAGMLRKEYEKKINKRADTEITREVSLVNFREEADHPQAIFVGAVRVYRGRGVQHVHGTLHYEETGSFDHGVRVEVPLTTDFWDRVGELIKNKLGKDKTEITTATLSKLFQRLLEEEGVTGVRPVVDINVRHHAREGVPVVSVLTPVAPEKAVEVAIKLEKILRELNKL